MGQARLHIHTKRGRSMSLIAIHRFPAKLIGCRLSRGPVLPKWACPYDQLGRYLTILWSRSMQRPHGLVSLVLDDGR
jgi:hypothetical protein